MLEATKDIVIALINTKQIANTNDSDVNIKEVNKAINDIAKKLNDVNHQRFDK